MILTTLRVSLPLHSTSQVIPITPFWLRSPISCQQRIGRYPVSSFSRLHGCWNGSKETSSIAIHLQTRRFPLHLFVGRPPSSFHSHSDQPATIASRILKTVCSEVAFKRHPDNSGERLQVAWPFRPPSHRPSGQCLLTCVTCRAFHAHSMEIGETSVQRRYFTHQPKVPLVDCVSSNSLSRIMAKRRRRSLPRKATMTWIPRSSRRS